MNIRTAICAFAAAILTTGPVLANDDYPSQVIRIVVPFQPGSSPDNSSRFVAQRLSELLKQPVIIENKPGAGGVIGADAVAKSKPDGYTIGYLSNQHLMHPYIMKSLPYDPLADFQPVSLVSQSTQVLVTPSTSTAKNLAEFIQNAKSRKEPLTFGSGGIGSPAHLAGQIIAKQAGFPAMHVPYKGAPEAVNAVIGGQIDYSVNTAGAVAPLLKAGKIKALALTSSQRQAAFPGVPTLAESMKNGLVYEPWGMFVVPAKTPQPVVEKLHQAVTQILKEKRTADYFDSLGSRLTLLGLSETDKFYKSEAARLELWIKEYGVKVN